MCGLNIQTWSINDREGILKELKPGRDEDSDSLSAYKHNWSSEIWHVPKIQFDFLKKKKKKMFNLINTVYAVVYVILWQTKDNTQ